MRDMSQWELGASVHEMLESLKHLGISYSESLTQYRPFTKFHEITLEIHWTVIENIQVEVYGKGHMTTNRREKKDSLSQTVYWTDGMELYPELVKAATDKNANVSRWKSLTYCDSDTEGQWKNEWSYLSNTNPTNNACEIDVQLVNNLQKNIEETKKKCKLKIELRSIIKNTIDTGDVPF